MENPRISCFFLRNKRSNSRRRKKQQTEFCSTAVKALCFVAATVYSSSRTALCVDHYYVCVVCVCGHCMCVYVLCVCSVLLLSYHVCITPFLKLSSFLLCGRHGTTAVAQQVYAEHYLLCVCRHSMLCVCAVCALIRVCV